MLKKFLFPIIYFSLLSCNSSNRQESEIVTAEEQEQPLTNTESIAPNGTVVFGWTGTINRKIPVFINFWYEGNHVLGEIIYQDSKEKKPISLYGTIADDGSLRILEFENSGNITGIIQGIPTEKSIYGTWFSPQSKKEYQLAIHRRESTKKLVDSGAKPENIAGNYHYQYGSEAAKGTLIVHSVNGNNIEFSITAYTGGNSPNLAEVKNANGILTGNTVIYKIPGSDNCEFKIQFFRTFASVSYTNGYCEGQFGQNATIDGLFLKLN